MSSWNDVADEVRIDLVLHILRTGTYHRGRYSGPPEDCYPDEYEDMRVLESVECEGVTVAAKDLPAAVVAWLEDRAADAEMEPPEEE